MANLSSALEVLSEQQVYDAVWGVYSDHQAKIKEKEYIDKISSPKVYQRPSIEEFIKLISERAKMDIGGLVLSENEKVIYRNLSTYFTLDTEDKEKAEEIAQFEKSSGLKLSKGLLLYGNVGCGKTTLMRLCRSNPNRSYSIVSCREISAMFAKGGYNAVERFYDNVPTTGSRHMFFGQDEIGICFDDLGTESVKKNFGNDSNVMAEILLSRYDNLEFNSTHITTNCNEEELLAMYGDRVVSRMHEMFNFVLFPQDSKDKRRS